MQTKKADDLEQVILVDENDQQIGVMDKLKVHRHPAKLHRASSVLLHNSQDKWLIQQRSSNKIVSPNKWANTCCGNVRPNETYLECALRRLDEELGITQVDLKRVNKFIYQIDDNAEFGEHEIDTVFVGQYDGKINPNPNEVQNTRWLSKPELLRKITNYPDKYAPWTKLVLEAANIMSRE